jgi:hypothetical protein
MKWFILSILVFGKKSYFLILILKSILSSKKSGYCFFSFSLNSKGMACNFYSFKSKQHTLAKILILWRRIFTKMSRERRALVKNRQGNARSVVFCGKFEVPIFCFWASHFSKKCHRKDAHLS